MLLEFDVCSYDYLDWFRWFPLVPFMAPADCQVPAFEQELGSQLRPRVSHRSRAVFLVSRTFQENRNWMGIVPVTSDNQTKSEEVSIYNLYRDYIYIWLYRIIGIYLTEDGLLVVCWWVVCLVCYQGGWSSWAGIFSHRALGLGQGDVHKQRKELWWIILYKTIYIKTIR